MLILITSDQKVFRKRHIKDILSTVPKREVIMYDDTHGSLTDLEQYIYPSLFSLSTPVLHLKFTLDSQAAQLTTELIKKLLASPTIFIFEEFALPAPLVTTLKKQGVVIHIDQKVKGIKKEGDIFAVMKVFTAPDKKTRWMIYRQALVLHPIEALIGIMYWKVKDLVHKNPKDKAQYQKLYTSLLRAHATAWSTGAPLELLIEKVILTH